jgi:hypothetical protein
MPVHPRDYKLQSKRPRKITADWFERVLTRAFTQDEIVDKVRNLSDSDVVKLYRDWIPRKTQVESNLSVRLIIGSVLKEKVKQIETRAIDIKALTDGDDEVD